jgi:exonuclease SbcC
MIIESIQVKNFLSHADSTVQFTDASLWLVCGENGAGKSALLDAVEYTLYGKHRGGNHGDHLLIKQGQTKATVNVVICLQKTSYRITRHLSLKYPTRCSVERRDDGGQWQSEAVDGIHNLNFWVKEHLPAHTLFRSAIFLRQNKADHFLEGSVNERMDKFKALLELETYTNLSIKAKDRTKNFAQKRSEAELLLNKIGDTSEATAEQLQQQVEATHTLLLQKKQQALQAGTQLQKAREWERLCRDHENLTSQKESTQKLLEEEPAIRSAAVRVSAWDRDTPTIAHYWRELRRCEQQRLNVKQLQQKAKEAEQQQMLAEAKKEEAQTRLRELTEVLLPASLARTEDARAKTAALQLEEKIADETEKVLAAQIEENKLTGKEQERLQWQQRKEALPSLRNLLKTQVEAATAAQSLKAATREFATQRQQSEEQQQALNALQEQLNKELAHSKELEEKRQPLVIEIARLTSAVDQHSDLSGHEAECPVCTQKLDEATHKKVQQQLSSEKTKLLQLETDRDSLDKKASKIKKLLQRSQQALEEAQKEASQQLQRLTLAEERLQQAIKAADKTTSQQLEAKNEALAEHPVYATEIGSLTEEWFATEEKTVAQKLRAAKKDSEKLQQAIQHQRTSQGILDNIKKHRSPEAQPLGDTLKESELQKLTALAQKATEKARKETLSLNEEKEARISEITRYTSEVASKKAEIKAARDNAEQLQKDTASTEENAQQLKQSLQALWSEAIANEYQYQKTLESMQSLRSIAANLPGLEQARGRLESLCEQLTIRQQSKDAIEEEHRVSVVAAETQEQAARDEESSTSLALEKHKQQFEDIRTRQQLEAVYRLEASRAAEQEKVYQQLTELLGPDGELQTEIARQEQQDIVGCVNLVLSKLGDPLSVRLGEPRRNSNNKLQDVLFVDTNDPAGTARYFDYLSGGEKFRVALALALALHSRVAKNNLGTLIIDEGFGSLDEHRRDALAQQMADLSTGILSLGLAHSIIICSHSNEVQRHFTHRWMVSKSANLATVKRLENELAA